ncbi:Mu transposase C-terminal domain-containing protein [Duganella fentianensis]|uniref:Mu transposase C-terminal domain-containing protein n=1 Tax=Duganella fentianensis TaxID=2692177 RepID=UPI0032B1CB56
MLLRNELLHYTQPVARTLRILWIDPRQRHAYLFDVAGQDSEVERCTLARIHADLAAGRATRGTSDPYLMIRGEGEAQPAPKHLALRDRAWQIIAPLVAQEPAIYQAQLRGALVAQATRLHGVSHPTVYRYLRRYWQRGQTPNALLPDYANSGGRGKLRQASAGVKRGRPRKDGAATSTGVNMDEEMRRVLRVAVARYAATHARFSRQGAYRHMLAEFFCTRQIDVNTGRITAVQAVPHTSLPSFGQFNYWLDYDDDRPLQVQRRAASASASASGSASSSASVAQGTPDGLPATGRPGAAFCLSVMQAELQLVSRADRLQCIGRPWLYIVTDAYSQLITGYYVGFGGVSRAHALLALAHCGADKARYCASYGRTLDAAQWPARHLPASLKLAPELGTGGEFTALLNNFNLPVCVALDTPQAWLPVLERRFRLLPASAPATVPARPGRLDGVLDLDEFHQLLLDAILYYNSRSMLHSATPLQHWQQGMAQHGNALRTYPEHLLRCSLLPVTEALVGSEGIQLFNQFYTCMRAFDDGWFERARTRGPWKIKVAYDPADMETIYLLDAAAPMQYHACHLRESSAPQQLAQVEFALLPRTSLYSASPSLRATTHNYASYVN